MAAVQEKGALLARFKELQEGDVDSQCAFFTRRFVFSLGDAYSDVYELAEKFKAACEADEGGDQLSEAGAANLLQETGHTRTALQRRAELKDLDLDGNGKTSFMEFLLLTYKVMVLREWFGRRDMEPDVDLSGDGVGVTGVGERLVEELFSVPQGVDKDLEAMMEEFETEHAKRKARIDELKARVEAGGVKGMAAKNELDQLKAQDETDMNAVEARIAAAVKKAVAKTRRELDAKEAAKADADKEKAASGRSALAERAAMFGKRVSQRLSGRR